MSASARAAARQAAAAAGQLRAFNWRAKTKPDPAVPGALGGGPWTAGAPVEGRRIEAAEYLGERGARRASLTVQVFEPPDTSPDLGDLLEYPDGATGFVRIGRRGWDENGILTLEADGPLYSDPTA